MTLLAAYGFGAGTGSSVTDDSGNAHALTVGSGSYTASGHTGPGFQSIGGGATTGASGTVPAVTGATCSLMAWVKPNTLAAGGTHLIAGAMQVADGSTDFALYTQRGTFSTPNVLQGDVRIGGLVGANGAALTVGVWAHVALTFDGSNIKLYKDGTLVATVANAGTVNNSTAFYVAGMNLAGTAAVTVDDVRYFNSDESANITTWMNTPVVGAGGSVSGTALAAFGGLSGAASGTRAVAGSAALAGPALTGAATGIVADSGVASAAFGGLGGLGAGVRGTDGAASAGFGGLSGTAVARSDIAGNGSASFGGLSGAVAGKRTVSGSGNLAGGALTGSATDGQGPGTLHHPSSTMVFLAWLRQVAGFPNCAATLPKPDQFAEAGFITVTAVGGNPSMYVPDRNPVFQVDCWAVNRATASAKTASRKLPFGLANELADRVVYATYAFDPGVVALPAEFEPVWIGAITPVSEVRKIPDTYARFSVDIQVRWAEQVAASYAT